MCDSDGKPDFKALMEGAMGDLCAWCFDLLELNGHGLRRRTLIERKASAQQGGRPCASLLGAFPRSCEAARRG